MAEFVVPDNVRDYLTIDGTTGQWSDAVLGSNIAAASGNLQRWTRRQFEPQGSNFVVTKRFSTLGRPSMVMPDARSVSAVRLNDATLTADESYWLIPDQQQSGVYVGIELVPRQRGSYLNRFDYNYSHLDRFSAIPNDLEIDSAEWGHLPYPPALLHAATVLAAYYTKRPDAVLGGVTLTAQGNEIDLSAIPREVADFVREWRLEQPLVSF